MYGLEMELIKNKFFCRPIYRYSLIFGLFFFPLKPLISENLNNNFENWFLDSFWNARLQIFDDAICDVKKLSNKNSDNQSCKEKTKDEIKNDADFLRKLECENFIEVNFLLSKNFKVPNNIKEDCRRIYKNYSFDPNFDPDGFTPKYVSFALGEELPFFIGSYKNGLKHGKGTFYTKKGSRYDGEFKNDEYDGEGSYYWQSGDKYIGQFKEGFRHGNGIYSYSDGSSYDGNWAYGEREGLGTINFSNGKKFIGEFFNSRIEGQGILFDENGRIEKQGRWKNSKLIESKKIELQALLTAKNNIKKSGSNRHETCLKAEDYKGCMSYGVEKEEVKKRINLDCINYVCDPEDAMLYGTDNLGLKILPGYYFVDIPEKRSANFWSKPLKLNVNGKFGRYIHIQRIIRYFSQGYSGSITTNPGIGEGSSPSINYFPGQPPGVRQIVQNHIFDCQEKTAARFNGEKLIRTETRSGKKKKWFSFDEAQGYTARKGIESCKKSETYIMSLNISPFDKFNKKGLKNSPKKVNAKINCKSPVWKNKPQCK